MPSENSTFSLDRDRAKRKSRGVRGASLSSRSTAGDSLRETKSPISNLYEQSNLTMNQLHVWMGQSLLPELPIYNLGVALEIRGEIDRVHFQKAFQTLVNSSDALRTVIEEIDGVPMQRVLTELPYVMDFIDFSSLSAPIARAKGWMQERCESPLDWHERLFDSALIKLSEKEFVWYLNVHHIICDGWSFELIYRHMADLYRRSIEGCLPGQITLSPFSNYVAHERGYRGSSRRQKAQAYWKRKLADHPGVSGLNGKLPASFTTRVRRISYDLGPERTAKLRRAAALVSSGTEQASLLEVLGAVLVGYLHCVNGRDSYAIGIPFHNRRAKPFKETIGFFSEVLPVQVSIEENETFVSLICKLKREILSVARHAPYPITNPYFKRIYEVVLNYHTRSFSDFVGIPAFPQWIHNGHGDESLALQVSDFGSSSSLTLDFDLHEAVFGAHECEQVLSRYLCVLEAFLANPEQPLQRLSLLSSEEATRLLAEWNATVTERVGERGVLRIFEEQVRQKPDCLAVVFEDEQLTYRELNWRANQLAHYLRKRGIGYETLVGLYMERSPEMIVGLLGILKTGAAYVPIDTKHPKDWLRFVLEDTRAPVLLTQERFADDLPQDKVQVICLDVPPEALSQESGEDLDLEVRADDLAYVIYTSGSTGNPKGVEIPHRALANFTSQAGGIFGLNPADRVLQFASISFDTSVEEIFPCLMRGATLVLRTDSILDSIFDFVDRCRNWGITVLDLPTAYWHELAAKLFSNHLAIPDLVRLVIIGGERAIPERLALWQESVSRKVRLLNTYGPTETTVVATVYDLTDYPVESGSLGELPIGRPILNVQTYVLDRNLNPVPVGVPGELYIGGLGLARGYLNQPALTAEKFIKNPFSENPLSRLYRTGDLVRHRSDGNLEFLGRIDRQVKIRGLRIELEGIEAVLRTHPLIQDAVVLGDGDSNQDGLVAYLVPGQGGDLNTEEVKHNLRAKLPDYMIPSKFVVLESLPLTVSGKVDRHALPAPERSSPETRGDFVPPRSPIERDLADMWSEILNVDPVGIFDNFFELGGHSLLATQVISRVRARFQIQIPLRSLFEAPTIAGLANEVEKRSRNSLGISEVRPLVPIARDRDFPLSFSQSRMWFMHQLAPESPAYNIPAAIRLKGRLNEVAIQRSLNEMIRRHESFRTVFSSAGGGPIQRFVSWRPTELQTCDLQHVPPESRLDEARKVASEEARRSFDLEQGRLMRVNLFRLAAEDHVLLLTMHHIIADQWSLGIIGREVASLYNAFCDGQPPPSKLMPVQYVDFAVWQREWFSGEVLSNQLSYWKQKLAGLKPLDFPTDRPRPPVQTYRGTYLGEDLSKPLVLKLKKLSDGENATLFMTLLAVFKILLQRYSGQADVAIGVPIANRHWLPVEEIVGTFVNTLVMRTDLSGDPTFRELLARVREVTLEAYAYQDMPFEKLVEELQPSRDMSRSPLIQVLFNLQNAPIREVNLTGLSWSPFEIDARASQYDIGMTIDTEITQKIYLAYNSDLYEAATISRMLQHYLRLLEAVTNNPDAPISRLQMLFDSERHALLLEWNDTDAIFPRTCVHELFEARVQQSPNSVAVVFEDQQITYDNLNRRANQLAYRLRDLGVGPEVPVGICVERSLELVVGLLGILKAGGAYVPIDPAYPAERIAFMLQDSQARVLLTQSKLLSEGPETRDGGLVKRRSSVLAPRSPLHPTIVCLDRDWEGVERESSEKPVTNVGPNNLAYVNYTSGSTGKPKGVAVPHSALVNFLAGMRKELGLTERDILLSVTTISFDIAALELYLPLLIGARVVLVSHEVAADGLGLKQSLESTGASVMQGTPVTWCLLVEAGWQGSAGFKVLCGGESLSPDLAHDLLQRASCVWNLYGPTETTVWSTAWKVIPGKSPCIGRPIANTQVYILDTHLEPVPVGVIGEIYIGGAGVARGYLNRPELTAERFVANPFREAPSARMYRTGDLGRYLPDGNIEFVGRRDQQVKVRGFRVELGEIEAVLRQYAGVKESVVVVREEVLGDKRLVAYVVAHSGQSLTGQELRGFLKEKLPEYMVPSAFVFLDALPLAPNRKVDRRALPAPDHERPELERGFVAPRTELERTIARIWREVLNVKEVGIHDNFFDLGGHSLLATQIVSRIRDAIKVNLSLRSLFETPTIAELTEWIKCSSAETHGKETGPDQGGGKIEVEL